LSIKELENYTTPMMKQYTEMKKKVPGKILFFRMGDFYELFGEDAKTSAPVLGIALTARDKKNAIPMCGVPYHSVSSYIAKLTNKGYSVAICEQVEDPRTAKGIVKRDIVRVVTPSLVYDSQTIDGKSNSYLVSILQEQGKWSFSFLDYSTGDFKAGTSENIDELIRQLSLIAPKEILYDSNIKFPEVLNNFLSEVSFSAIKVNNSIFSNIDFNSMIIDSRLSDSEIKSAKLILYYLVNTQFITKFPHVRYLSKLDSSDYFIIDEFTSKNLDLFDSFLKVLDFTKTAMGGRLLKKSIAQPFKKIKDINKRLDCVETLIDNPSYLDIIGKILPTISDIDRLSSKISVKNYNPRDFKRLLESLKSSLYLKNKIKDINLIYNLKDNNDFLVFLEKMLLNLEEKQPNSLNDANIFKKGFNKELDELIDLHVDSKKILKDMEVEERQKTRIPSLKIRYNKIFGYYIDITKTHLNNVPDYYNRKQTLVNSERFITEELKDLELKLLNAEEKRKILERKLLEECVEKLNSNFIDYIFEVSNYIANIDLIYSFTSSALKNKYTRPEVYEGFNLNIKDASHPVLLEKMGEDFIANNLDFSQEKFFHILTGPNMAGKSTIMRTIALIVIMSHMGAYVSASYSKIPLTDRIFTRVGATDYILQGQSTFMVEMIEASNIIRSATKNSLIILDEIGRGTSTYDGISIAWAIAEYIHNEIGAKCMFATHYHELVDLEKELKGIKNYSMAVEEEKNGLFFVRKIIDKPSSKSYGIQVASMAGLPERIIKRSYSIMKVLEKEREKVNFNIEDKNQLDLFLKSKQNKKDNKIFKELNDINLNELTPFEALARLYKWKEEVKKD
jgi:DNA mismatch repair protein MutS